MSEPKETTARQKALALAALAHGLSAYRMTETAYGVWVENKERSAAAAILGGGWCAGMGDTQIEALATAAEALGLEPDPILQQSIALHYAQYAHLERAITNALAELDKHGQPHAVGCDLATAWGMLKGILQQQEQTPASPPVHLTVKGQHGDNVAIHITEAEHGLRLQATGDGESSAECVSVTGDVQWTAAGMVMVPTADVAAVTSFLALFRGKEPSQVYDMAPGARERLEELITTFAALAPKESTPDPQEGGKPDA